MRNFRLHGEHIGLLRHVAYGHQLTFGFSKLNGLEYSTFENMLMNRKPQIWIRKKKQQMRKRNEMFLSDAMSIPLYSIFWIFFADWSPWFFLRFIVDEEDSIVVEREAGDTAFELFIGMSVVFICAWYNILSGAWGGMFGKELQTTNALHWIKGRRVDDIAIDAFTTGSRCYVSFVHLT